MSKMEETLARIAQEIVWDNWKVNDTERYMKVTEVLHCRLEWIADSLKHDLDNIELPLATIKMVQEVLSAIECNQ